MMATPLVLERESILQKFRDTKLKNPIYNVDEKKMQAFTSSVKNRFYCTNLDVQAFDSQLKTIRLCGFRDEQSLITPEFHRVMQDVFSEQDPEEYRKAVGGKIVKPNDDEKRDSILSRYKVSKSKTPVFNAETGRIQGDSPTARNKYHFLEVDVSNFDSRLKTIRVCGYIDESGKLSQKFQEVVDLFGDSSSSDNDEPPPTEEEMVICNIACNHLEDCSKKTVLGVRDYIEKKSNYESVKNNLKTKESRERLLLDIQTYLDKPEELESSEDFWDLEEITEWGLESSPEKEKEPYDRPEKKSVSPPKSTLKPIPLSAVSVPSDSGVADPDFVEEEIIETFGVNIAPSLEGEPEKKIIGRAKPMKKGRRV